MGTIMNRASLLEALASGAARGVLCGFDEAGEPLVDFPANESRDPVDPARPIIVGVRQSPLTQHPAQDLKVQQPLVLEVDGERLVYTAQKEIVLRCGKASIQLLSDGSVRIRGTNVLTRASATNRIRGGNVQIN
jgi:hypothetical protein